jgi:HEAT repeat protein
MIKDPVSVEPLTQLLQDDDVGIRMAVGNALTAIDKPAVSHLVRCLINNRDDIKKTAVEILGRIKAPESIEALVRLLKDNEFDVRFAAEYSLRNFGELATPFLLQALDSENSNCRKGAANVLGHIRDKRATMPLCRMLKNKNRSERISALEALEKIADKMSFDYIASLLRDRDKDIRRLSVKALGKIGDVKAVISLVNILKKDKDARQYTCEAIEEIFRKKITKDLKGFIEPIIREFISMLGDDYTWSHASSILILIDYPVITSLITVLHTNKNRRIRKRIPQILAEKVRRESEYHSEVLNVLCQSLQDKDKEVKISAAFALEKLQDLGAVDALAKALDDIDVRFAAELALKKLKPKG